MRKRPRVRSYLTKHLVDTVAVTNRYMQYSLIFFVKMFNNKNTLLLDQIYNRCQGTKRKTLDNLILPSLYCWETLVKAAYRLKLKLQSMKPIKKKSAQIRLVK